MENLELPVLALPDDLTEQESKSNILKLICKKEVEEYVRRKAYLKENVKKLFSLILGQCTKVLKSKLEASETNKKTKKNGDDIPLILEIRQRTFNF